MSLAASRALQIDGVKAAARAKRSVIKMTLKGAGRRIAYGAVQNELRQGIRAVNVRIREERQHVVDTALMRFFARRDLYLDKLIDPEFLPACLFEDGQFLVCQITRPVCDIRFLLTRKTGP